jgi:hypothetical protein
MGIPLSLPARTDSPKTPDLSSAFVAEGAIVQITFIQEP